MPEEISQESSVQVIMRSDDVEITSAGRTSELNCSLPHKETKGCDTEKFDVTCQDIMIDSTEANFHGSGSGDNMEVTLELDSNLLETSDVDSWTEATKELDSAPLVQGRKSELCTDDKRTAQYDLNSNDYCTISSILSSPEDLNQIDENLPTFSTYKNIDASGTCTDCYHLLVESDVIFTPSGYKSFSKTEDNLQDPVLETFQPEVLHVECSGSFIQAQVEDNEKDRVTFSSHSNIKVDKHRIVSEVEIEGDNPSYVLFEEVSCYDMSEPVCKNHTEVARGEHTEALESSGPIETSRTESSSGSTPEVNESDPSSIAVVVFGQVINQQASMSTSPEQTSKVCEYLLLCQERIGPNAPLENKELRISEFGEDNGINKAMTADSGNYGLIDLSIGIDKFADHKPVDLDGEESDLPVIGSRNGTVNITGEKLDAREIFEKGKLEEDLGTEIVKLSEDNCDTYADAEYHELTQDPLVTEKGLKDIVSGLDEIIWSAELFLESTSESNHFEKNKVAVQGFPIESASQVSTCRSSSIAEVEVGNNEAKTNTSKESLEEDMIVQVGTGYHTLSSDLLSAVHENFSACGASPEFLDVPHQPKHRDKEDFVGRMISDAAPATQTAFIGNFTAWGCNDYNDSASRNATVSLPASIEGSQDIISKKTLHAEGEERNIPLISSRCENIISSAENCGEHEIFEKNKLKQVSHVTEIVGIYAETMESSFEMGEIYMNDLDHELEQDPLAYEKDLEGIISGLDEIMWSPELFSESTSEHRKSDQNKVTLQEYPIESAVQVSTCESFSNAEVEVGNSKAECSTSKESHKVGMIDQDERGYDPSSTDLPSAFCETSSAYDSARYFFDIPNQPSESDKEDFVDRSVSDAAPASKNALVGIFNHLDYDKYNESASCDATISSSSTAVEDPQNIPNNQESVNMVVDVPSEIKEQEPDLFELSSNAELKPIENAKSSASSPSSSSLHQLYHRRKTNEDIIESIESWNVIATNPTPLKSLLVEASKRSLSSEDWNMSPSSKEASSARSPGTRYPAKTPTSTTSVQQAAKKITYEAWNSPARLPIKKNGKSKSKGKSQWVPLMCCSYANINNKSPRLP